MDTVASSTVTMPRAAYAARFTLCGLRAFTSDDVFPLLGQPDRAAEEWRRFAPVDVVRLAVARRLLDYGFTVRNATHVIDRAVDKHVSGLVGCGVDLPVRFIIDRLEGLRLHVSLGGDACFVRSIRGNGPVPHLPHNATLTINVGAVAADALDRLTAVTPNHKDTP